MADQPAGTDASGSARGGKRNPAVEKRAILLVGVEGSGHHLVEHRGVFIAPPGFHYSAGRLFAGVLRGRRRAARPEGP